MKKLKYIGTQAAWTDRIYDTGLAFTPNMIRELDDVTANKLLRHTDVFEEDTGSDPAESDTDDIISAHKAARAKVMLSDDDVAAVKQQVMRMSRRELDDFSQQNWRKKPKARASLDDARNEVMLNIDQFGVIK